MAKPTKKPKKSPKKRAEHYNEKPVVNLSFIEIMQVIAKDANNKSAPPKTD